MGDLDKDHAPSDKAPTLSTFRPIDRSHASPSIQLPDEVWLTLLESPCTFPPDIFDTVMLNLIKNPNITSSHLFRADILYDSGVSGQHTHLDGMTTDLAQYLKADFRPRDAHLSGFNIHRTIVRELIPRNPQLDVALVQTCHFLSRTDEMEEQNVVLYIPHIQRPEHMPFYHPAVPKLAFLQTWRQLDKACLGCNDSHGHISISYTLFPDTQLTPKLERTALRLLQTVHKHGQGQLAGYEKRVHLDQVIPQKRYQDTYTRLKAKYGKQLAEHWVEVTDPGKHVFEDIGIAAFLIELWKDMYLPCTRVDESSEQLLNGQRTGYDQPRFPDFVDIGCGNGVLVYILAQEGYDGFGFDARQRKTWSIFPSQIQERLHQRILVPDIMASATTTRTTLHDKSWHNGRFPPNTFIISNHADELTSWTPLLAYLNDSAFLAIPCCSHDLAGARFRAPPASKTSRSAPARLPQQREGEKTTNGRHGHEDDVDQHPERGRKVHAAAAETGSLKRTEAQKKMPSAYATLCSYVSSIAEDVGFRPEKDVLRIPSTRNQCIVGRHRHAVDFFEAGDEDKRKRVIEIIEREVGMSVSAASAGWIERAEKLAKKPGSGH